jgi:hypothetical protein
MCGQIYGLGEANISFFISVIQLSEFFSHNLLFLINRGLLFCMLSVIHHCIMADSKKQCICFKFCLKLTKTASRTQETKSGFTVKAQKQNGNPVGEKAFLSTCKESEASQVRHLHVCVIFYF